MLDSYQVYIAALIETRFAGSDVKGECNTQDDCALGLLCLKGICKIGADAVRPSQKPTVIEPPIFHHQGSAGNRKLKVEGPITFYNRLRIGADCGSLPHMCMCGATCQQSVCRCDTDVSVEKNGLCQPKDQMVGGYCSVSKPCLPRKAECEPVTSTCVCPPQHSVDQATLTCQLKPGDECISQTMACTLGDVCDYDGVCKINTGHSCAEADQQNLCRWGTSCDRGLCRIDLDHSCARHKDMCREHLVCDVLNVCKRPVGAGCSRRKQCPAGAMCSPDNKCTCVPRLASVNDTLHICEPLALKVGGQCWMGQREEPCEHPRASCYASRCRCQDNFVTDWDFSCYRPAGGSCEEEDDVCVSGTVCSSSTCKYRVGQMCHPLQPNLCVDSAICDVDFVCRLDFTSSCDSYDKHCRHEAVCDNTYRCMRGTGYNCSDEPTLCVAGSYCLDGLCTCLGSSRVEPSGTLCLPRAGRVTGRCNPGCVDPNAFCTKNDTCACKQAFVVNLRDYSCLSESPAMPSSSDDGTDDQWWWLSIMGGIVAMALVILAVSVGLKKKNEREMEIIEDIERTRERLFQLSLDVDQINAESRAKDVSVSDDSASSDRHRTDSDDSASSERLVFSKGSDISSHPSNASSDEESVNTLDSDESEM
ncbi:uncharacterized protein LOC143293147 [Babylonia areolata]|uniref:uncharacterized protein LOC143293147 n=1 Tax=Babylonia areolata TaxID=304850 RepID=UPI003FD3A37F